jgi:hypothetical protein
MREQTSFGAQKSACEGRTKRREEKEEEEEKEG